MSDNEEALPSGSVFASYEIVRVLGEGAFGVVYEALRQPLGKRVALKVLHKKLVTQQEILQRFLREAQTTAQIQHPHIVETFDIGEHDGSPYLAMEFIEGEPLNKRIKRDTRMQPALVVDMMLAVLSAMATVHERGVVHRDLKPENIFLMRTRGGGVHPKVLDFGIAKVKQHESEMALTRTTALLGTPYYMSPEQARESKHIDALSDQWALGVILYECLTGRRPFVGASLLELLNRIAMSDYVAPTSMAPEVPPGLEAVIARMLQRDPLDRFSDVRAVGFALLPFATDAGRALWVDEFTGRSVSAPPPPDDDISETIELAESAATAAAPSLNALSRPPGASSVSSASGSRRQGPPEIALTAAMTSSPLPASGGTLTLAARESQVPVARSSPRWMIPAALGALALVGVGTWMATHESPAAPATPAHVAATPITPPPFHVTARVEPATAAITLDQEAPVVGSIDRVMPSDGRNHTLRASAPGYRPAEYSFSDHFSWSQIVLVRDEPAAPVAPVVPPVVAVAPTVDETRANDRAARLRDRSRRDAGAPRQHGPHGPEAPETGSNGVAIR